MSVCGVNPRTFTPFYPRKVMLSYSHFSPERPLTASWAFVHEGVRFKTMDSCITSKTNPPESPYFEKLSKVLEKEKNILIGPNLDKDHNPSPSPRLLLDIIIIIGL
jgi:hypothetical protein